MSEMVGEGEGRTDTPSTLVNMFHLSRIVANSSHLPLARRTRSKEKFIKSVLITSGKFIYQTRPGDYPKPPPSAGCDSIE